MSKRYESAHREIRAILQREPHLTAKELWHQMTDSWPVPPVRTVSRYMKMARLAMASGAKTRKPNSDSVERTDRFSKEEFYMGAEDKLDTILKHLGDLHEKCDGINKRMDSIDEEHKELRAATDAEAKEKEEKAKADAAVAAAGPKANATAEDRSAFAGAQLKLDSATQAWGFQARPPLAGESLRNYRISILSGLKQYSKAYKDSDLSTIGDENAFTNIEGMIINDAIEASNVHIVPGAPLTRRTRVNEHGQRITTFHGDAGIAWAAFAGGGTQFGKINQYPNSQR